MMFMMQIIIHDDGSKTNFKDQLGDVNSTAYPIGDNDWILQNDIVLR